MTGVNIERSLEALISLAAIDREIVERRTAAAMIQTGLGEGRARVAALRELVGMTEVRLSASSGSTDAGHSESHRLREGLRTSENELDRIVREQKEEETRAHGLLAQIDGVIAGLEVKRPPLLTVLPPDWINRYEAILRTGRRALAIASTGICGECKTSLSREIFVDLQRRERLESCPGCERFLYLPDLVAHAETASMAKRRS